MPLAAESFTRDTSGEFRATRIPQAVPLVMSRRLISAVRNEGVPLFERAKISFPVSLFIPAVGDQCSRMFSDTRSIFRCLSRATGFSLSLSLSTIPGVWPLSSFSITVTKSLASTTAFHNRVRDCYAALSPNAAGKIRHDLFGT